jgi:hypothetical protein
MPPYVNTLQTYLTALGRSDYTTVKSLFAPGGKVLSPFLGEMTFGPFFDRLAGASTRNVITPIDIFLSATETKRATAYLGGGEGCRLASTLRRMKDTAAETPVTAEWQSMLPEPVGQSLEDGAR